MIHIDSAGREWAVHEIVRYGDIPLGSRVMPEIVHAAVATLVPAR